MARGSIGRTVARAASTGGSRNRRGPKQTPLGFYTTLVVVVLLGLASVAFSRYQTLHPPAAPSSANNGPAIGDHWLVAYAFDLCGKLEPNPPKNPGTTIPGIYTTGNGLIQVAPKTKADASKNATLGRFVAEYPGMKLSSTSVGYPGSKVLGNGALCGSKPGKVQARVFSSLADTKGSLVTGNPADLHLTNGSLVTIAFVAPGAAIPRPPSAAALAVAATTPTTTPTKTAVTPTTTKKKKGARTTATTTHTVTTKSTAPKAPKTSTTTGPTSATTGPPSTATAGPTSATTGPPSTATTGPTSASTSASTATAGAASTATASAPPHP